MELKEVKIDIKEDIGQANSTDPLPSRDGIEAGCCGRNISRYTKYMNKVEAFFQVYKQKVILSLTGALILGYFVYFVFALIYHVGDEGSWRLIGCTILGVLLLSWQQLKKRGWTRVLTTPANNCLKMISTGKKSSIVRW